MTEIKLSSWLLQAIQNGDAILFLGAGASMGAICPDGRSPLSGSDLGNALADTFLGGKRKDWPLDRVADYAKSLSSSNEVQSFIKEQFEDLQPADFHLLIPRFRWFAIITTNYDLIIYRDHWYCHSS